MEHDRRHALTLGGILLLALAARLYMAVSVPVIGDEYLWMALADTVDLRPSSLTLPIHGDQHPPVQVYLAALGAYLFGPNQLGYRAASVLLGTLAVLAMYFLGRRLAGPTAGLLAAFLLATNQYHIGISHLTTEKNYLTFALLALLAFERAITRPWTTRRFLTVGLLLGVGMLTKQTLVLWALLLVVDTVRHSSTRSIWREPGPWLAALLALVIVTPDLYWNLTSPPPVTTSGLGIGHHLLSLSLGSWSWAPFALYFRPVYFNAIESALSEYASMTTVAGLLVLVTTTASVFVLKTDLARRLQWLGFATLGFFLLFTRAPYEFWWADLALLAFLPLTAAVLVRFEHFPARLVPIGVALVMTISAGRLLTTDGNYFPLDWGRPPQVLVDNYMTSRRQLLLAHRDRDPLPLCSTSVIRWPVCGRYVLRLKAHRDFLEQTPEALTADTAQADYAWVTEALDRFQAAGVR